MRPSAWLRGSARSDALVRLSVGVEELGDLQVDLERALEPVDATSRNGR